MNKILCTLIVTTYAFVWSSSAVGSITDQGLDGLFHKAQQQHSSASESVFMNFWGAEFKSYGLHSVVRSLIDEIDNAEMLTFLGQKGVDSNPKDLITSANLIAYLRHKHLGNEAVYAWIDLQMGKPDFVGAVLDWQSIRNERGYEFVPTYYLLSKAILTTKRDAEVWADFFKATFSTLPKGDIDKKNLMLLCLLPRILGDLKVVAPQLVDRFDFLSQEIKTQSDLSKPYPQLLLMALWEINFGAKRFHEAGAWAKQLTPPATGLFSAFVCQLIEKDLDAARATVSDIEKLSPKDDKMLNLCRQGIKELEEIKRKQGSNNVPENIGTNAPQPQR